MTEFIKVDEEYINSVVHNAAWDAARVPLEEGKKKGDKSKDKPDDKPDFTTDSREGDKGKGADADDKPDFTTKQRKGDKSKTHKGKDFEREDSSVEAHECPLCESVLEEALSDEVIYEHVSQIQEALIDLEEMKEGDDDDDSSVGPTDDELDDIEKNPVKVEKKSSKKESILQRVASMKSKASN